MARILVVRNDKIGDFMLAWPALAVLRASWPQAHIAVLVPAYTAPLARLSPVIDEVIIDGGEGQEATLLAQLKAARFDHVVTLFSTWRIGKLLWRAGIRSRVAPATKWAQIFYNDRLAQRRSRSEKAEWQYNLELMNYFLSRQQRVPQTVKAPYLTIDAKQLQAVRAQLELADAPYLAMHIGTGGSARNLSAAQYAQLATALLHGLPQLQLLVTAGPGEEAAAQQMVALVADERCRLFISDQGLEHFVQVIACCQGFIAGSTGPLHIAGA